MSHLPENPSRIIHRVPQAPSDDLISITAFAPTLRTKFALKETERYLNDVSGGCVISPRKSICGRDDRYNYYDRHKKNLKDPVVPIRKFDGDFFQTPTGVIVLSFVKLVILAAFALLGVHMWIVDPTRFLALTSRILLMALISYQMGLGWNPYNIENHVACGGRYWY
jgi:hypothetical protein